MHYALCIKYCFNGEPVTFKSKATDDAATRGREVRVMAELLALMYVGDMHFDDRTFQRTDTVVEGYAGVSVRPGIEYDSIISESHLLHLIDEFSLNITLIVVYLILRIAVAQLWQIVLERRRAVDARLSPSEEIEVWTVDNLNPHILRFEIFTVCSMNSLRQQYLGR